MNILFALYGDLTCNSASHVDAVARELSTRGCNCVVAVPWQLNGLERFAPVPYQTATFEQVLANPRLFPDGQGPALLHCWTPREVNRRFQQNLAKLVDFRTVIHWEDNEEHITRCALTAEEHERAVSGPLTEEFPGHLSHPRWSRHFQQSAAGASLLIESLGHFLPADKPRVTFWPAADARIWHPRPRNEALRAELGIAPETCVLTYHGNVHKANAAEVRSLYLAVALLNREGHPTRLVRLGQDYPPHPPEYYQWAQQFTIDLGFVVDRQRVADVLAMADLFVQPGRADVFNDYRFPSKLPEFFALGRPVVLPRTNIGLVTRHLEDAYVLDEADGTAIYRAVEHLRTDAELYARLSEGARRFAAEQLSWSKSADDLLAFYHELTGQSQQRRAA